MKGLMVDIHGSDLPGRRCGPTPDGGTYENIHVGLKRRTEVIDLVPGDAGSARWEFEISVRAIDDAQIDFGGPFVHGKRGERALGLCWGTVAEDGAFNLFWAAKLRLSDVDPSVVWEAMTSGGSLVASLGLTDSKGWPRCASVRPPVISWSVEVR